MRGFVSTSPDHRCNDDASKELGRLRYSPPNVRVLHLAAGNLFGGVETFLLTLARHRELTPDLESHFGVCFPGRLREELTRTGCSVHDLEPVRIRRPWTIWRARRTLRLLLQKIRPDVVITHSSWLHGIFGSAIRHSESRLVHFVHGALSGKHWLERWASRTLPDHVIANSEYTATFVSNVFPTTDCTVLYCPVEKPQNQDATVRNRIRRELGTSLQAVVILTACRIERWKGPDILLDAISQLRIEEPWECWIAGGPQRPSEKRYFAELVQRCKNTRLTGRVKFLGQRSDVGDLMAAADLYCQPNRSPEPFGIVFVEALYHGLPVITSTMGGPCEIVTSDCGVLVAPNSPQELSCNLRDLICSSDARHSLAQMGPARAGELCEPARQLSRFSQIISNVTSKK